MLQPPPPAEPIVPKLIEVVPEPSASISMIEVALAAFGLTGVIMLLAVLAGLIAGGLIILYRRRRPITTIEARGHEHNLFRA